MKRVLMLLCFSLALLSLSGSASAYTAEIAYYFQGLEVNCRNLKVDVTGFFFFACAATGSIYPIPTGLSRPGRRSGR